jgi:hypothetical protein
MSITSALVNNRQPPPWDPAGHRWVPARAGQLSRRQPPPRAGARRAPCALGRPRDGPILSRREATARRRAPARGRSRARRRCGRSAGARSGVGPLVRRRRAVATSRQQRSRRALPVQSRDQLRSSIQARLRLLHRPVERRRSSIRNRPARSPAVALEPDPQERRRDVGRASVPARARTTWRPPLP